MKETIMTSELRRLPGLFRSWELPQVLKTGQDYHLEEAGKTCDGTRLISVFEALPLDRDDTSAVG